MSTNNKDIRELFAEMVEGDIFESTCKTMGMNPLKVILDVDIVGDDREILRDLFNGMCEHIHKLESVIYKGVEQLDYVENNTNFFEAPIIKNLEEEIEFQKLLDGFTNTRYLQTTTGMAMLNGGDILEDIKCSLICELEE